MVAIEMISLSPEKLAGAIALANRIFPDDADSPEAPALAYTASLDPGRYRKELEEMGVDLLSYWLLIDTESEEQLGFTGLYHRVGEPVEVLWLGWFGIAPHVRSCGLGRILLAATIEKAKMSGATLLRLYTSDSPNEAHAQKLYDNMGFVITKTEPRGKETYFYREKKLR